MKLIESIKKNPQDYYLQSGVDEYGNPIYDLVNEDIADYAPNKALRKKVFDGNADIVLLNDRIQIYWKSNLVAEAQLVAQLSDNGGASWDHSYDFNFADANINKIIEIEGNPVTPFYRAFELKDFPAISVTDAVMGMDQHWAFEDTKQIFYLDVPGWLVRIRWQCRVKDSAIRQQDEQGITERGLWFSVHDYKGEVNHGSQADPEEGWTQHWWTFEPNGYQCPDVDARTPKERFENRAGLYIDPYLYIDEQATYTDVYCDGFVTRIQKSVVWFPVMIREGGTDAIGCGFQAIVSSSSYVLGYDPSRVVSLIENTALRVVFRIRGNLHNNSIYLSNSTSVELFVAVYPDKVCFYTKWITGGSISLDNSENNGIVIDGIGAYLTNETGVYESSGSEVEGTGEQNSADYLGILADEVNYIGSYTDKSAQSGFRQIVGADETIFCFGWNNVSLSAGTYLLAVSLVLDFATREGSAKIYNTTDRLAIGDQFKDPILDQSPSKGDDVTDMILPVRISSGTLHSDGAHFYEPDSNDELQITLDRVRIRPAFVIRDWPFQTGLVASPTSHILNRLKMDDNAANNTLVADVGPNGSWHAVSDGSSRNTNSSGDSVQRIGRGRNLDTQNETAYGKLTCGVSTVHDNAFMKKGSFLCVVEPQFVYNTASTLHAIFYLTEGGGESSRIRLYYNSGTDQFFFRVDWNTVQTQIAGTAFTENYSLQRQMAFLVFWDSDKDIVGLAIDGRMINFAVKTDVPGSNEPSLFLLGGADSDPPVTSYCGDYVFDEIITFDEAILPFGAFHIGNGQGLLTDISNPHADLSWYFDGQAAAAKGGSNLATDKNPINSGGQFVTTDPILGTYHWDSNGVDNGLSVADVAGDIADYNYGFMAMWFNAQSISSGQVLFDVYADSNNSIYGEFDASGNLDILSYFSSVYYPIYGNIPITAGKWNFLKVAWNTNGGTNGRLWSYINGMMNGTPVTLSDVWGGGTGLTWQFTRDYNQTNGVDAFVGMIAMGKNPYMPEVWTAFGKPLHDVRIKKNGTEQQKGGTLGYDVVTLPDGSKLITTEDELTS